MKCISQIGNMIAAIIIRMQSIKISTFYCALHLFLHNPPSPNLMVSNYCIQIGTKNIVVVFFHQNPNIHYNNCDSDKVQYRIIDDILKRPQHKT